MSIVRARDQYGNLPFRRRKEASCHNAAADMMPLASVSALFAPASLPPDDDRSHIRLHETAQRSCAGGIVRQHDPERCDFSKHRCGARQRAPVTSRPVVLHLGGEPGVAAARLTRAAISG